MYQYSVLENILFPPITYLNKRKLKHELEGKTILITGASSGIGEQLAYSLADIKVHMILVARREEKLMAIKRDIEKKAARVSVLKADLRNKEEIEELITFIHELPDGLDFVVSNAGKSINRSINDSLNRFHDFTRTMDMKCLKILCLLTQSHIPLHVKLIERS